MVPDDDASGGKNDDVHNLEEDADCAPWIGWTDGGAATPGLPTTHDDGCVFGTTAVPGTAMAPETRAVHVETPKNAL